MKRKTDPAVVARAEGYVEKLRDGDIGGIEKDVELQPQDNLGKWEVSLNQIRAVLPTTGFTSVKVVGYRSITNQSDKQTEVRLEYEYPDRWVLISIVTRERDGETKLTGFHAAQNAQSLENFYAFRLFGNGGWQYVVLALGLLSFACSIGVFVSCLRTKGLPRKWLWAICTLVGFGNVWVNWTTGEWSLRVVAVGIPTIGMSQAMHGPWIVSAFLPVGAIWFLLRRDTMRMKGEIFDQPAITMQASGAVATNPADGPLR
jgi:hypothetical protein